MKKWIFLILLLNINISYGDVPLGYKTLNDYCHYYDPHSHATLSGSTKPLKGECINQSGEAIQTVLCCHKSEVPIYSTKFWIKISPTDTKCPIQGATLSDRCSEKTGVH